MKKKVSLLGKEFSVFAIVAVAMIGLVSAALVPFYGMITGMVTVSQSVTLDGLECTDDAVCTQGWNWEGSTIAGNSVSDCNHIVKNNADVPATIDLVLGCTEDCEGVTTGVYGTLEFAKKDLDTGVVSTTKTDEIEYTIVGDEFVARDIPVGYKLIYYPDMGEFTINVANILVYGEDTFPSLPVAEDMGDDYCNIEILDGGAKANPNAKICDGAKLWLVEDSYVSDLELGVWTPEKILFETDLIVYSVDSVRMTLQPKAEFDFCVDSEFVINLRPDDYTITTEIVPVVPTE